MVEVGQYTPDEQAIFITDSAKAHLLNYITKEEAAGVRFSVKKAGCSGLSYVIDYVKAAHEDDIILSLNETHKVCIDKASFPYLKGMTVDYVREGLNARFEFKNPNQKGQCGCGESFTI